MDSYLTLQFTLINKKMSFDEEMLPFDSIQWFRKLSYTVKIFITQISVPFKSPALRYFDLLLKIIQNNQNKHSWELQIHSGHVIPVAYC